MKSSVVNGKLLAARILDEIRGKYTKLPSKPRLGLLVMSPDFATQKFLAIKHTLAQSLGVILVEKEVPGTATDAEVLAALSALVEVSDGVVVQLPLSSHIDTEKILSAIPATHDVDGIGGGKSTVLPPVVGAIAEILAHEGQLLFGKKVVIVGRGRLVGAPAAVWFEGQGSEVVLVDKQSDVAAATKEADIVVLGAGEPGLLTPEMVKEGAVILDAGTSESGGKLAGDATPDVVEKARLFTPVPGGIGPVAVAMIFRNLLELSKKKLN